MQKEFPKCPICDDLTNGYEFSGVWRTKYAQCHVCKAKWALRVKKQKILELTLHELPKDGSAAYTIATTKEPLFTIFGTPLPTEFWKNLKLDKGINWEFLSKNVSSDASKAVFLEKGEKILHQWEGRRETPEEINIGGKTHKFTKQEDGILLLSTQKLRWLERRERGFPKKTKAFLVVYDTPLQEVRGISGGTGDSNDWKFPMRVDISVVDKQMENRFKLYHAFLELFKPIIDKAVEVRKDEIEAQKKKERLHVMLDFSFLKTHMEKGGIVMQVLKCPHCNGKIEFPKSGTKTKCSYCGNTIYAQDIFEKIKSLLE